ncbi:MAG: cytochrome c biogenesis protein CcsA [Bacillaceae bacterium]|nr:cytochrome c biogenesis protein CcsA [Bacillaceae bacterium]
MFSLDYKWIYELMIFLYAISLIGYFIDFVQQNRRVNRLAFWFLSMVWILQTIFLFGKMLNTKQFYFLTIYDGLYFYAWILITFSMIINRLFRVDFFVFFTNVVGFFIMTLHISTRAQLVENIHTNEIVGDILIIHIAVALLSYGIFTLSFIFALMFLLQYTLLKKKKWSSQLKRLGNLDQLDYFSFLSVLMGVPILMIAIILGVLWAYISGETFYWYDIKTIGSFIVLGVYVSYLILRVMKGLQGKQIAVFNVYAFLFLLVNYFLFSTLSNFHF